MKKTKSDDLEQSGRMLLAYGETGVGKTVSIIQSAPSPIAYVQTERRSLKPSLDAADRKGLKLDVFLYTDIIDLLGFLAGDELDPYATIVFDGYSAFMNIALPMEMSEEKAKDNKTLSVKERGKTSLSDRGSINTYTFRTTSLLGTWSQKGKIVICTALLQENPKWNRSLAAAPALGGKEVPNNLPGFFDLIGLVTRRSDDDGGIVYPPLIRFEDIEGKFICKFTGKKPEGKTAQGPFNVSKILGIK